MTPAIFKDKINAYMTFTCFEDKINGNTCHNFGMF